MNDTSSHDAPLRDDLHSVSLRELEARVVAAGVLISRRQLMRHCQAGTFDAQKLPAVNNIMEWFIAPASIEKGIADIKTLQEQRARRDATRPVVMEHVVQTPAQKFETDTIRHDSSRLDVSQRDVPTPSRNAESATSGHDETRCDTSDTAIEDEPSERASDATRHDVSDLGIYEHPYVKRLENQVEKLEAKYEAQVRRTEEIQIKSAQQIIELQRMTAIGQSQTLADFMLKARNWVLGQGSDTTTNTADAPTV